MYFIIYGLIINTGHKQDWDSTLATHYIKTFEFHNYNNPTSSLLVLLFNSSYTYVGLLRTL